MDGVRGRLEPAAQRVVPIGERVCPSASQFPWRWTAALRRSPGHPALGRLPERRAEAGGGGLPALRCSDACLRAERVAKIVCVKLPLIRLG